MFFLWNGLCSPSMPRSSPRGCPSSRGSRRSRSGRQPSRYPDTSIRLRSDRSPGHWWRKHSSASITLGMALASPARSAFGRSCLRLRSARSALIRQPSASPELLQSWLRRACCRRAARSPCPSALRVGSRCGNQERAGERRERGRAAPSHLSVPAVGVISTPQIGNSERAAELRRVRLRMSGGAGSRTRIHGFGDRAHSH